MKEEKIKLPSNLVSQIFHPKHEPVDVFTTLGLHFDPLNEKTLGQKIKILRKNQNLSEIEFAKLAGVSRATVQKIEAGNFDVTFKNIKKVLDAAGLELGVR